MGKYDNIINEQWPKENKYRKMPMEERAKIFLPFAALKGYEDAIEEKKQEAIDKMNSNDNEKIDEV